MLDARVGTIATERLLMRRVRQSDLVAIHDIMSNCEAMKYWSTRPHSDLAETEKWLASMMRADEAGASDEFIIEYRGTVIGKLGVWREGEVGFFFHPACWGRGFATEALNRFIAHAKAQGMKALRADVHPQNLACLRVLESCGFRSAGHAHATHTIDGEAQDSVYMVRLLGRRRATAEDEGAI